jgi:hypothetical protein
MQGIRAGWSDDVLPLHSHVCFYYTNQETLQRSLAFLRVGLDEPGELCMLFADEADRPDLLSVLQQGYPGRIEDRIDGGKLVVLGPAPTRQEVAIEFGARLERGLAAGFTTIRLLGYPGFGRARWPSIEDVLCLEDDCNDVAAAYPAVIVCAYGPELEGDVLMRGLNLHPSVWLNGDLTENPLYSRAGGSGEAR